MQVHGGDPAAAMVRFGGTAADWLDLSTGINPVPFALPEIPQRAWTVLPMPGEIAALEACAADAYGTRAAVLAVAGAQAAIQLIPHIAPVGDARILGPTYAEHSAALCNAGWRVMEVGDLRALAGADLAVVVNPNNPDGRRHAPDSLVAMAERVGLLVVDESFVDAEPALSLAPCLTPEVRNIVVQRSFGKFFGLAGLRLGFVVTGDTLAHRLRAAVGPWQVSGPGIVVGQAGLRSRPWQAETRKRLLQDAARLDAAASRTGWTLVGGTLLFRTYETGDAAVAQNRLAEAQIWSRIFPYAAGWLRLGLPGNAADWVRLERALSG
ncbi:MAG: threonine-phosphate decarboxylase CobD [Pseudomonadota bacterium]